MYNKIYEFCKVRNFGNVYSNIDSPTPRVLYLISLLESMNIEYELDKFPIYNNYNLIDDQFKLFGYNIILKGNSDKMLVAHHDVSNHMIDNANDNSASVINAVMVKKIMPEINVILLDGEEFGGIGSNRLSKQINNGYFGNIKWVLNLELTGKGGKYFFIGNYPGELSNHIKSLFNCPIVDTPYNDSVTFRRNGIDSCVINSLPILNDSISNVKWDDLTYLDYSMVFNCHSNKDNINSIDINDMKEFVEHILIKILSF